jgi:hypothetical protein
LDHVFRRAAARFMPRWLSCMVLAWWCFAHMLCKLLGSMSEPYSARGRM